MKSIFFKPFERYSEFTLLIVGSLFTIIGSYAAFLFDIRFDGVIDVHVSKSETFIQPLIDNLINICCLVVFLFSSALIFNKKTRIVDILTTSMVARIPFYLLPVFNFNGSLTMASEKLLQLLQDNLMDQIPFSTLAPLLIFGAFTIIAFVWYLYLLYSGFKTASNAKGNTPTILFISALLFAEIASKILISLFN